MDNEDLAEDILALSNLFRMVLSQGKGIISVQEEMGEFEIPKLVLQPFAENAIVHGFEKQTDCCKVTVCGCREGAYLKFVIKDTGIGMSREQIADIDFVLSIESREGKGTAVTIKIPCKGGEE